MIVTQEATLLKAKDQFQKIEEAIRQATIQGTRIDVVEEDLWDRMLGLGRLAVDQLCSRPGNR